MNFKLHIPNPCSEDWNSMQAIPNGKHCEACNKNLVDFRTMSDQQIYDAVNVRHKVCGLFSESQMEREFDFSAQRPIPKMGLAVSFVSLLAFVNPVKSQETEGVISGGEQLEQTIPSKETIRDKINNTTSKLIEVKGTVSDKYSLEPIPFATINIKNNKQLHAVTDFDGNFILNIPKTVFDSVTIIKVSVIGYQNLEMEITETISTIKLELENSRAYLGDIIIIEKPTKSQKFFDLFRRKKNKKYNYTCH